MEKEEIRAAEAKPYGYIRIRFGQLKPDDLLWIWPAGKWLRHDDRSWSSRVETADEAFYAIRQGKQPEPKREKPPEIFERPVGVEQAGLF